MRLTLKILNLSLLILFPVAWFAPLMKSGILPFLSLSENSIMSALQGIWAHDIYLALLMTFFAIFAPYIKIIGLALIHFNLMSIKLLNALTFIGKLAMADIFLIALYITLTKGIGIGRIEVAWGLYLFTACILTSMFISWRTEQSRKSAVD